MLLPYISGLSLQAAAHKTGLVFVHSTLGKMIDNELYMGSNFYPAIITVELWYKAQAERIRRVEAHGRNRNTYGRNKTSISPFRGILFCSECGAEYRRYSNSGEEYWHCAKRLVKNRMCCNSPIISETEIEKAVMRAVGKIDITEISVSPVKRHTIIENKYDDPFRQAEYVFSQTQIDDFDHQTGKLLTALKDIPESFNGSFITKIIKRIEVPHTGAPTFVLINGKQVSGELKINVTI